MAERSRRKARARRASDASVERDAHASLAGVRRISRSVPRAETLQLFGSHLFSLRKQAGLSLEVFARGTTRNVDWVQSVERGACCPSQAGFEELELGFENHEEILAGTSLQAVFEELEREPLGEGAQELRQNFQFAGPSAQSDSSDPDGLVPLLQDIAYQDRLLTLTPLALLLALLATLAAGRPRNGNGIDIDFNSVNFDGFTLIALAVTAAVALVLPSVSRALTWACAHTRVRDAKIWHTKVSDIRAEEGAVDRSLGWYVAEERIYSVPEHWGVLRSTCLEVDLYERIILVLLVAIASGLWCTAVAIDAASGLGGWFPWASVVVILAFIATAAYRRQQTLARAVATRVSMAYGIQPSPPQQLPGS